jgi:hypothetical protein
MKVTITDKCHRCQREAPREVDSSEIPGIEAAEKKRKEVEEQVREALRAIAEASGEAMPDVVLYLRGQVSVTQKICDAFCVKTVGNARDAMFKVMSERKGRPKKNKDNGAKSKDDNKTKTKDSGVKDKQKAVASSSTK